MNENQPKGGAKCRSCGASIFWRRTGAGALIPINPIPANGGNIILDGDEGCEVLSALSAAAARENGTDTYLSHFATCPEAKRHRAAKKK